MSFLVYHPKIINLASLVKILIKDGNFEKTFNLHKINNNVKDNLNSSLSFLMNSTRESLIIDYFGKEHGINALSIEQEELKNVSEEEINKINSIIDRAIQPYMDAIDYLEISSRTE